MERFSQPICPMSDRPPTGFVFFRPGTPAPVRRRRLLFCGVMVLTTLALTWPVYALFSGIRPLILGLPLSLAWIVAWLFVSLIALIWLYRTDHS